MRPFDAMLFDMDGVLIHSRGVWFALLQRLCRQLGYPVIDADSFAAIWGQGVQADADNLFVRHSVEELTALYDAHFLDHADQLRVDPDAHGVLSALTRASIPTAIVTNTPRPLADALVQQASLVADTLVAGTDCEHAKPAPDMVLEACERLSVGVGRALMIGDTPSDRGAAESAGATFCGFGGIEGTLTAAALPEVLKMAGL